MLLLLSYYSYVTNMLQDSVFKIICKKCPQFCLSELRTTGCAFLSKIVRVVNVSALDRHLRYLLLSLFLLQNQNLTRCLSNRVLSLEDEVTFYINGTEIEHINRDSQYSSIPVESFFFTYGSGGVALPGTIMIDNVSIIPEPASFALLAIGTLLIRRKK